MYWVSTSALAVLAMWLQSGYIETQVLTFSYLHLLPAADWKIT